MAFTFDGNENEIVRSLCANASLYLLDATIDQPYYKTTVLNLVLGYLTALGVDYDTEDAATKQIYQNAAAELLASRCCRHHLLHRPWMESNNKSIAQAQKIDWGEVADMLEAQALAVLDPTESTGTSGAGLKLVPSSYNQVTGVTQEAI